MKVGLDVDGIGYATAVLESEMRWTVDQAHCTAVGVCVGHEVKAVSPFPEIRLAIILFCPFLYRLL